MVVERGAHFLDPRTSELDVRFERVFKSALGKHIGDLDFIEAKGPFWDASSLGLDRVDHFRNLDGEAQNQILSRTTDDLLREACFIEMAGMTYTARMSLSSSSLEERIFYSLMASEEARHFCLLRPFTSEKVLALGPDPFTALIGEIIDSADREHAILLVQVLLEGWGLNHISWMAGACNNEDLRANFKTILKDEARHHGAGLALTKDLITVGDRRVVGWLEEILHMVRLGPVRLMAALQKVSDISSPTLQEEILEQLDAQSSIRKRLMYLVGLLSSCVDTSVMKRFEDKRLFEPSK